jgi:hypothetical protein
LCGVARYLTKSKSEREDITGRIWSVLDTSKGVKMSIMPLLTGFIAFCSALLFFAKKKKPEVQNNTYRKKQSEELITVILPTINNDK